MNWRLKRFLLKDQFTKEYYKYYKSEGGNVDLWACAAGSLFSISPADCMETLENGEPNTRGKLIRDFVKHLVTGIFDKHRYSGRTLLFHALDNYEAVMKAVHEINME